MVSLTIGPILKYSDGAICSWKLLYVSGSRMMAILCNIIIVHTAKSSALGYCIVFLLYFLFLHSSTIQQKGSNQHQDIINKEQYFLITADYDEN
jgi:hypothetical protein